MKKEPQLGSMKSKRDELGLVVGTDWAGNIWSGRNREATAVATSKGKGV